MISSKSTLFPTKFGQTIFVAAVYYLVAKSCLLLAHETTNVTAIWPPTGIALAAVLLYGCRICPAIALGAFFANIDTFVALNFSTPLALAGALVTAIGNALGALASGFLVLRFSGGRNPFHSTAGISRFVLYGALVGTNASAVIGAGALSILHGMWTDFPVTWLTWWLGDAVAVLIITPLIMTWEMRLKRFWTPPRLMEAATLVALLLVVGWAVFFRGATLPYLFVPILIWSAFRFGKFEAACLILLMLSLSIWGSVEGVFIYHSVSPKNSLLLTQVFIGIASVMTMLLISLIKERDVAAEDLRRSNENLQQEIAVRLQAEEEKANLEALNSQLQKAESLGRMAGAIAHHFNNLLTAVIGNLEMAMRKVSPEADTLRNLERAMEAARRASEVSVQMLNYLGQTPGLREPMDLSESCSRSLPILRAISKDLVLRTDLPLPGPVIVANPNKIQLLLENLVANAWESMAGMKGAVHLAIRTVTAGEIPEANRFPIGWKPEEKRYACLEVVDAGCGIAVESMENIFDPFYSTKFVGRGMGLPAVLGILRSHEGAVTVHSEEGKGSIFRCFLPLSREEVAGDR